MAGSSAKAAWGKVKKRIAILGDLAVSLPWLKIWRLHDKNSDTVVWIHGRYPAGWLRYLVREDTVVKDAGLLNAMAEKGKPFRMVFGRKIDSISNSTIIYTIHPYNPHRTSDYSEGLIRALDEVEARGNTLFPPAAEARWWENKVFMHERFEELGVRCPTTAIVDLTMTVDSTGYDYPILAKEPHSSGSRGVHKITSAAELDALVRDMKSDGEPDLILQQLIDMRRDFRATLVGDRVVHSYFRINTSEEWKPTSTSRGSIVDFDTFPEQWRSEIESTFKKCNMYSGAFDITWDGDDLTTQPYFLEISPTYTPNPPPPVGWTKPYADFKKVLFGKDSYPAASRRTVFEIADMLIDAYGV